MKQLGWFGETKKFKQELEQKYETAVRVGEGEDEGEEEHDEASTSRTKTNLGASVRIFVLLFPKPKAVTKQYFSKSIGGGQSKNRNEI